MWSHSHTTSLQLGSFGFFCYGNFDWVMLKIQFDMDPSDSNIDRDQEDFSRDDDLPFDPDCTLILYGIHGRNTKGLYKKLSKIGQITYFQPVKHFDTIIFAYDDAKTAQEAIDTIADEKILFCTVREPV